MPSPADTSLVALAAGPQEIETFPQFQLEEQKLENSKGQRSLSEAMGFGNYHDLARDEAFPERRNG
jgi:hypothetical protein